MVEHLGWALPAALVLLTLVTLGASRAGGLGIGRDALTAEARAVLQLTLVSFALAWLLRSVWSAAAFALLMFTVAVVTTIRRTGAGARSWPAVALALAAGLVPVLAIVFGTGAVPLTGPGLVPIAGILIGGVMTAHSLAVRRAFSALREDWGQVEAGLAVGLTTGEAVREVTGPHLAEALVPALDQTRTVGLVTLPGAFVGVLLGGGSAVEAGAAQVLVLVGLLAAQSVTIVLAGAMIRRGAVLPADIRERRGFLWA